VTSIIGFTICARCRHVTEHTTEECRTAAALEWANILLYHDMDLWSGVSIGRGVVLWLREQLSTADHPTPTSDGHPAPAHQPPTPRTETPSPETTTPPGA
jgi:hypothetical protein